MSWVKRWSSGRSSDRGMTLIEVSVAMVIVSIIFAALAGLLMTTVKAQRLNELRVQGTQLAQERLENLRAIPWTSLGLYNNESGYRTSFAGLSTVDLGIAPTPRDGRVPFPLSSETLRDVVYTITTDVTWAPGSSETNARAKSISVQVSWEQYGSTRSVSADVQRASTSMEVPVSSGGSLVLGVSLSATPAAVNVDSAGEIEDAITLEANTTTAVSQVRVSYPTRTGVVETVEMNTSGDPSRWTLVLPAGTGVFDPGTTRFTVQATDLFSGQATGEATVEMTSASGTLAITTVTPNPAGVDLDSAGRNDEAFTISATFNQPVSSATLKLPTSIGVISLPMTLDSGGRAAIYTVTKGAYTFSAGDAAVVVEANSMTTVAASRTISFIAAGTPVVDVVAVTAEPGTFCAEWNGQQPLRYATTLLATVNGLRSSDKVQMRLNTLDQPIFDAVPVTASTWRVYLNPGGLEFKNKGLTDTINVTVTATRMPDGTPTTKTQPFSLQIGGC